MASGQKRQWHARACYTLSDTEYVFVLLDVPAQGDVMDDDDGCHWDDDDQKKIQKKV